MTPLAVVEPVRLPLTDGRELLMLINMGASKRIKARTGISPVMDGWRKTLAELDEDKLPVLIAACAVAWSPDKGRYVHDSSFAAEPAEEFAELLPAAAANYFYEAMKRSYDGVPQIPAAETATQPETQETPDPATPKPNGSASGLSPEIADSAPMNSGT